MTETRKEIKPQNADPLGSSAATGYADFLADKHTGMRIDHSGVLGRIASGCKVRQDQRWCLGEMDKHLVEMATRFYSGDIKAVDEFLQLYCLDEKRPEA